MDAKLIGKRLRELRGSIPMQVIANVCGISKSALSMYEAGQRIPRDEIKIKLAKVYKSTVQNIFFLKK